MGKSPHRGGQGRFFPRLAPGSPEKDTGRRGHGALKDMADREKRARRLECGHRWGRSLEMQAAGLRRTQACAASCCPRKTRTACRQRTGRVVCAVPGCGQQGRGRGEAVRAGSAEIRRQLPCPGALHGAPEEALPDAGRKKAPAGQGLSGQKAGSGRI